MELKEKVLNAALWVSLSSTISRIASILATLILAKLLNPLDFGIVAIAVLITSAIGLLRELGLSRSLIVQKENLVSASSTAFYLLIGWNLIIYLAIFFLSPLLAEFFKNAALVPVIRIMTLSLLIATLGDVPLALLEREMAFKKVATSDVVNLLTYGVSSVILAYAGFSYWSIVYGTLIGESAKVLFIWTFTKWRPKLIHKFSISKDVVKFGGNLTGIGVVTYIIRNIDDTFVGRLLGLVSLGHYNFAFRIANIPATNITNVIGRIMFPAYSQISEHTFDLRNAFNKTFYITAMLTIPLSLMIIAFTPDFLHLFYGNKWNMAILPIQIMAISGLIRSLGSGMGGIFLATKRPEIMLKVTSIQLAIFTALLYPTTTKYGITGVCILRILIIAYSFFHSYSYLKSLIKIRSINLINPVITFFIISILSFLLSLIVVNSTGIHDKALNFFTKVSIFLVINVLATLTIKQARLFCLDIFKIAKQKFTNT